MCLFQIPLIHATVAPAFIPGFTHPCHGSSLVYAGLPHTNEHLCDHVFIIIRLVISKTGMKSQMMLSSPSPETVM